jgi:hypothetical protein
MMACSADWGGWHWLASGLDEDHAREHLRQRLEHFDPFFGGTDHGLPGFPTDTGPYRPMIEVVNDVDERYYVEALEERERRDYHSA